MSNIQLMVTIFFLFRAYYASGIDVQDEVDSSHELSRTMEQWLSFEKIFLLLGNSKAFGNAASLLLAAREMIQWGGVHEIHVLGTSQEMLNKMALLMGGDTLAQQRVENPVASLPWHAQGKELSIHFNTYRDYYEGRSHLDNFALAHWNGYPLPYQIMTQFREVVFFDRERMTLHTKDGLSFGSVPFDATKAFNFAVEPLVQGDLVDTLTKQDDAMLQLVYAHKTWAVNSAYLVMLSAVLHANLYPAHRLHIVFTQPVSEQDKNLLSSHWRQFIDYANEQGALAQDKQLAWIESGEQCRVDICLTELRPFLSQMQFVQLLKASAHPVFEGLGTQKIINQLEAMQQLVNGFYPLRISNNARNPSLAMPYSLWEAVDNALTLLRQMRVDQTHLPMNGLMGKFKSLRLAQQSPDPTPSPIEFMSVADHCLPKQRGLLWHMFVTLSHYYDNEMPANEVIIAFQMIMRKTPIIIDDLYRLMSVYPVLAQVIDGDGTSAIIKLFASSETEGDPTKLLELLAGNNNNFYLTPYNEKMSLLLPLEPFIQPHFDDYIDYLYGCVPAGANMLTMQHKAREMADIQRALLAGDPLSQLLSLYSKERIFQVLVFSREPVLLQQLLDETLLPKWMGICFLASWGEQPKLYQRFIQVEPDVSLVLRSFSLSHPSFLLNATVLRAVLHKTRYRADRQWCEQVTIRLLSLGAIELAHEAWQAIKPSAEAAGLLQLFLHMRLMKLFDQPRVLTFLKKCYQHSRVDWSYALDRGTNAGMSPAAALPPSIREKLGIAEPDESMAYAKKYHGVIDAPASPVFPHVQRRQCRFSSYFSMFKQQSSVCTNVAAAPALTHHWERNISM